MSELVESFVDLQIDEETPEPEPISEVSEAHPASRSDKDETNRTSEEPLESNEDQEEHGSPISPKSSFKYKSSHPEELIIGNKDSLRKTRSAFKQNESLLGLISLIEPTSVDEAISDDGWIVAMQEELNQFERNDVWCLVPKPPHKNIIRTKWVFQNKINEQGEVVRNKARLVAQGYSQREVEVGTGQTGLQGPMA
ncbi:gag-pol polyprotein [Trifolium medium]|uniref:Gag-pol polyprotein n=1 Tax=Trifolium medium TaxID=97028 RepID=A0A392NZ56_9FABA|nr:gag-pol polyprotein [Trifolium medium]